MTRIIVVAVIVLLPLEVASGNLILNGSFESPTPNDGNQQFNAPSSAVTGWSVTGGSIDLVANGSTVLGTSHSGSQMIDINGASAGTIQQSFATTPGNKYLLELFYSNNPNPSEAQPSYAANVSVIGSGTLLQQMLTHSGATTEQMNWQPFHAGFVANSVVTTLRLQSSQAGFNGVYFDSVSVVPEPCGVVLSFVAMCGVVCFRFRRASVGRSYDDGQAPAAICN